ncbi:hypothetical protein [Hymenobacter terricola]|uniref:hypothetical protein n=1 Tax=Hymenobacter terricola TaxID=2819236 RepID=UPI001B3064E0|nr:hypothetical protein [Hymenobacter terricola]
MLLFERPARWNGLQWRKKTINAATNRTPAQPQDCNGLTGGSLDYWGRFHWQRLQACSRFLGKKKQHFQGDCAKDQKRQHLCHPFPELNPSTQQESLIARNL